jgi:hypothetical protein
MGALAWRAIHACAGRLKRWASLHIAEHHAGLFPPDPDGRARAITWLDGAFSAGDLMMVAVLLRVRPLGLLDESPTLAAYVARGEARPAYERAFAAQWAINAAGPHPG